MAYGQINYPQKIGWCNLTIAQVGCFLTSFSNLELRFGRAIDPPSLNTAFKNANLYINGCDLAWNSISRYDSNTPLITTGTGIPPSNNAIVEFVYSGTTHFCLVNDINTHTVVDSWDGKVRDWNYYYGPKAWATYRNAASSTPVQATRVVGGYGVNYRSAPNTTAAVITSFEPGATVYVKGYVTGENYYGNPNWLVGAFTGGYMWSGSMTNSSVSGLPKLN